MNESDNEWIHFIVFTASLLFFFKINLKAISLEMWLWWLYSCGEEWLRYENLVVNIIRAVTQRKCWRQQHLGAFLLKSGLAAALSFSTPRRNFISTKGPVKARSCTEQSSEGSSLCLPGSGWRHRPAEGDVTARPEGDVTCRSRRRRGGKWRRLPASPSSGVGAWCLLPASAQAESRWLRGGSTPVSGGMWS